MGNGLGKLGHCFTDGGGGAKPRRRQACAAVTSEPYDESLGHSFCYVRGDQAANLPACAISGATVSANASTLLSTALSYSELTWPAASAFESSDSFSAVPLQPVPRFPSGPLSGPLADRGFLSGPIERGFLSGPIERGFMSGPIDRQAAIFSGPLDRPSPRLPRGLLHGAARAISRTLKGSPRNSDQYIPTAPSNSSARAEADEQWAQGKAGEDRVHVVVSEERGWVFVGIYDGFNGPDATDYLLSNLYSALQRELKGLLWEDKPDSRPKPSEASNGCCREERRDFDKKRRFKGAAKKWEEKQRKWKWEWEQERTKLDRLLKDQLSRTSLDGAVNHQEVLNALSRALLKTEEAYLDITDKMVCENPELALMGSCVLVLLLKGDDVYLMNVGDSRAVLAHKSEMDDLKESDELPNLAALQFTWDHSTCVEEEVQRIRNEHPDDDSAIVNDRVKGSLKVTRAFGAGFLKQPKWNNALLEMFRIDYVGTSPYITCSPTLYHHKLGSKDRFLILSSDGLYQYFTNEEAVAQVELFMATSADGDPAQHLVEEVLFRAADKAGMDFHELLEIPQGDRRRYHDDVSIIVISLEGRIWRSSA